MNQSSFVFEDEVSTGDCYLIYGEIDFSKAKNFYHKTLNVTERHRRELDGKNELRVEYQRLIDPADGNVYRFFQHSPIVVVNLEVPFSANHQDITWFSLLIINTTKVSGRADMRWDFKKY